MRVTGSAAGFPILGIVYRDRDRDRVVRVVRECLLFPFLMVEKGWALLWI